ncbi:MAG: hypothetical protein HQ581_19230 [Planctomycetes bacterium]|nr:hypothetical protein [Planctomycetota bacterium]
MMFWQLTSAFRGNPSALQAVLERPEWHEYLAWFQDFGKLVDTQDRAILDAELPDGLCRECLKECSLMFFIKDGFLVHCVPTNTPESSQVLSALEVFERFGGTAIEDACEYGSFPLPVKYARIRA